MASTKDWFYSDVLFVCENGLMQGCLALTTWLLRQHVENHCNSLKSKQTHFIRGAGRFARAPCYLSKEKTAVLLMNSRPAFSVDVYAPEIISQTGAGDTHTPLPPASYKARSGGQRY